jgi:superfamily II DNA or RNA helicase
MSIEEIYKYSKDFGITKAKIKKAIKDTSKTLGLNQDETTVKIIDKLKSMQYTCINQASNRNLALKPYQKIAVRHMLVNKGMIAAFSTGTGKTLTAVAVAGCIVNLAKFFRKEIKIIIITPTSLQENFKKEMTAYGSDPTDKMYKFYTTAKFGIDYKARLINCKKSLFIIDEAHVFRTDYRHIFSQMGPPIENSRTEFALMCSSKAWKVLLLTATPIYNKPYDLVNLVSMAKGLDIPFEENPYNLMTENKLLFKEQYGNVVLFQQSSKIDYPTREDILVKIIMTPEYLRKYEKLEEQIREKITIKNNDGEEKEVNNAFMVKLRTASNNLEGCVKCDFVMKIIKQRQKTVFFSEFKSSGVDIIIELLKNENIGYYIISGEISMKERNNIIQKFDSKDGYKLLIITKAGSEGLDLKGVRNVIIFEQGWNISREDQVVGRAVRYKSHINLPIDQQNVKIWYILAIKPWGVNFDKLTVPTIKMFDKKIIINREHEESRISLEEMQKYDKGQIVELFGIDAYMFLQSNWKYAENIELKKELEKIQISLK